MTTPTRIAVPMMLSDAAADAKTAVAAVQAGANLIEWRMDQATPAMVDALFADAKVRSIPWILTVRPTWEGGKYDGDDLTRLALIRTAITYRPEFLDLELKTWTGCPPIAHYYRTLDPRRRPKLILSSHHFDRRPENLKEILSAIAAHAEASVAKIAFTASDANDALDALELYDSLKAHPPLQGVFLAMGEHGMISRTLAGKYGSAFTFGVLPGGASTAPGQPLVSELIDIYRLKAQRPDWAVFGLIGFPVAQSVSPHMHNAAMQAASFPGVYVRFPLPGEFPAFERTIKRFQGDRRLQLRGLSVTIPHKENACRYVKAAGGEIRGRDVGAINTILFSGTKPVGMNTDAPGGLNALLSGAGWTAADLHGRHIAIIGAGGAAAGLASTLADHGCRLTIYNRNLPRAESLAAQLRRGGGECRAVSLGELETADVDAIIQCTPVGMYPHTDAMPIPETLPLRPGTVVMDTIYNPRRTKLLRWAADRGAICIEGVNMLVGQGALQFEAFTGLEAPLDMMRDAACRGLGL
ncbi:MAG: shikimate dehydrogenase [Phycisphaerae bacterium]